MPVEESAWVAVGETSGGEISLGVGEAGTLVNVLAGLGVEAASGVESEAVLPPNGGIPSMNIIPKATTINPMTDAPTSMRVEPRNVPGFFSPFKVSITAFRAAAKSSMV